MAISDQQQDDLYGTSPNGDEAAAVRKFQRELNAGTVALLLLAVLDQESAPTYGYAIAKRLEDASPGEPVVKQGTLYPVLRSMQEAGWLVSEVEPSVLGPPRRYYAITPEGRRMLRRWREVWQRTRRLVDAVLEAPELLDPQRRPPDAPLQTKETTR
jgi:PadR family transcriptional regulator PadR